MKTPRSTQCNHSGSLFLENGEDGGFRIRCGWCWDLGPESAEPKGAIRAFKQQRDGCKPRSGRAA